MRPYTLLLLAPLGAGCVWETDLPAGAKAIAVDGRRELVIVDDAIVSGPLAGNANAGPLGFRHAMDGLGLQGAPSLRWLRAWSARLRDEGRDDRAAIFDQRVTCAWLRRSKENGCDDACAACATSTLAPESAPFRLIAVANRTDLSVMPDRAAGGGEGRLVFALTDGAADDATSPVLPMTVIFEYAQEGTAFDWASRWHALGPLPAADFPAELVALTETFVGKGSLAQVRTADAFTGATMVLHQFELAAGDLVASNVRNTPDWGRVAADDVGRFLDSNADAVAAGTYVLPQAWWAATSSPADPTPQAVLDLPQHDVLVRGTCGGCHAETDAGFQIDPLAQGEARLSRFLVDPTKAQDEMGRRTEWMQLTLSQGR